MDLRDFLYLIRRWWWLMLLGVILGGAAAYFPNRSQTPVYQTKTTLVIGDLTQSLNSSNTNLNQFYVQLNASQRLAQIYAEMIKQEPVLRATSEALDLGLDWTTIRQMVRGALIADTQFFEIYVTDTDPVRAKVLADEIAQQLVHQVGTSMTDDRQLYYDFIKNQLTSLQTKIVEVEQKIKDIQAMVEVENTTEGIQRRQEEAASLEAKLTVWQSNYASLLTLMSQGKSGNTLTIVEPAVVPTSPINQRSPSRSILIGMMVGLVLTGGIAFLVDYLDDTVKTADDIQENLGWTTLTTVVLHPRPFKKFKDRIVVARNPFSPIAEAYRSLRTNLEAVGLTNSRAALLVTSMVPGEGKTMTTVNLAVALAQTGKRVLLVDADLRHPTVDKVFDLANEAGLSNLLINPELNPETVMVNIKDDVLQIPVGRGLWVLPSGSPPPNPAELIGSGEMQKLITRLKELVDIVVFDSPPLLVVTDASLLARQVEATLLVVEAGRNRAHICQQARERLSWIGVEPVGVVLNKQASKHHGGYYYYYQNSYYHPSPNGREKQSKRRSFLRWPLKKR